MQRNYSDTDGKCFAAIGEPGCAIWSGSLKNCGTYRCPFYKDEKHKDHVRLDGKRAVIILTKEEYFSKSIRNRLS